MKAVKVTRKSLSRKEYLLLPSRVRMIAIYAAFFALAVMVGMLIRILFNRSGATLGELFSDWIFNLAIVVGGSVIFALVDYSRWTIRVVEGESVEGPSGAMGARLALPVGEIDWDRSRRSLNSWLKVGNAIYTFDRQRILISPWFYNSKKFSDFLSQLGYRPEN